MMEDKLFSNWIQNKLYEINRKYLCGTNNYHIISTRGDEIILGSDRCIFNIHNRDKEDLVLFEIALPLIDEQAKQLSILINDNTKKVARAMEHAKTELNKENCILTKDTIVTSTKANGNEATLTINFDYKNHITISFTIYMDRLIQEETMTQGLTEKLVTAMKEQLTQQSNQAMEKHINAITEKRNLPHIIFNNFKHDTLKQWDFEAGYISYGLDLNDVKNRSKFLEDITNCIKTIKTLYDCSLGCLSTNRNIIIGQSYYYYKRDTKEYQGDTYEIYEGRISGQKPINFLFKNKQQIFGRKRVSILKAIGLGRRDKNSEVIHL